MANLVIKPEQVMINPINPDIITKIQASNFFEKIIHNCESKFSNIKVIENSSGRFLVFDNFVQSGIVKNKLYNGNVPYINYFLISCLLNPNIKNILMLGMGTGRIANCFEELIPDLERFDIVDIDKKVLSVSQKYFGFKEDSKIKVHIQDATDFVKNTKTKYDVVILDIGNSNGVYFAFHTEEFLGQLSGLLNENGILISNVISSYNFNSDENVLFKSTLKTYRNVFNDVMIIPTIYGDHLFHKVFFDLEEKVMDVISALLFSSKGKISVSKEELVNRAKKIQQKSDIQDIEKLDKFANDLLTEEINTDKFKSFRNEHINNPELNSDNLKSYFAV